MAFNAASSSSSWHSPMSDPAHRLMLISVFTWYLHHKFLDEIEENSIPTPSEDKGDHNGVKKDHRGIVDEEYEDFI